MDFIKSKSLTKILFIIFLIGLTANVLFYFNSKQKVNSKDSAQKKSTISQVTDWKKYASKKYKFSLEYPSQWKIFEEDGEWFDDVYFSIDKSNNQKSMINVRVIKSVGTYWINTENYFNELYTKQGSVQTSIAGSPAVKEIIFGGKSADNPYYATNVYIYENNLIYRISNLGSNKKTVDANTPVFEHILSTFSFTH